MAKNNMQNKLNKFKYEVAQEMGLNKNAKQKLYKPKENKSK